MAKAKYIVTLTRDVVTQIGHLTVNTLDGDSQRIDAPTEFVQTAGPRAFQTRKRAEEFQKAQRAIHGHDVCSEISAA